MDYIPERGKYLKTFERFTAMDNVKSLYKYITEGHFLSADCEHQIDTDEVTLFHVAAYNNSLDTFIFLEKQLHFQFSKIKSSLKLDCLHYACKGSSFEVAVYLLNNYQADIDKNNDLYIKYALLSNSIEVTSLLYKRGFNYNITTDIINDLIVNKKIEGLKFIIQLSERNKKEKTFNLNEGTSLINIIAINNLEMMKLMFEHDENLSFQSFYKDCLKLACLNNCEYAVEQICNKVENIDIPIKERAKGAIHWACSSCNPKIVKMICDKNINIDRYDENGNLGPVEMIDKADSADFIDIMQILIDKGFKIDQRIDEKHNSLLASIVDSIEKDYEVITWFIKKRSKY